MALFTYSPWWNMPMKWSLPCRWTFAFAGSLSSPLSFSIAAVPLQYGRPLAVKQRPATTTNFERSRQTEQSGGAAVARPAFLTSVLPSFSVPYFHSFRRSLDCQLSKKLPRTWRLDGDGRKEGVTEAHNGERDGARRQRILLAQPLDVVLSLPQCD